MTRVGDVKDALKRMDNEIERIQAEINSANTHNDKVDHDSILNGEPYSIGQTDRSEDAIPNVASWVDVQRQDDAMKVCAPVHLIFPTSNSYALPVFYSTT